jgi:hypothetical protein
MQKLFGELNLEAELNINEKVRKYLSQFKKNIFSSTVLGSQVLSTVTNPDGEKPL